MQIVDVPLSGAANKQRAQSQAKPVDNEFVSDAFKTTAQDLDEVKAGMKLLGIDTLATQTGAKSGKHWTTRTRARTPDTRKIGHWKISGIFRAPMDEAHSKRKSSYPANGVRMCVCVCEM